MSDVKLLSPIIQHWEGKFSNDPLDSGGATMMGITLRTYKAYCKIKGKPEPKVWDLANIQPDEWDEVLKTMYWDKWQADQINNQSIANILVDWVWASGAWGIKIPQRILHLEEDGIVGYQTLYAVNTANQRGLFQDIKQAREQFVWDIVAAKPDQKRFINGWLNRINSFTFA